MNPAAVSVGLIGIAILGGILFVILVRLLYAQDAHTLTLAGHGGKIRTHDQQLANLGGRFDELCRYLGVEVNLEDVDPDWAEQDEPADDDTQEFPAIAPDTEPMGVIPARVDDVPLARVAAEIEADRGEPGSYVDDVELALVLAELEGRIHEWRRNRAAV